MTLLQLPQICFLFCVIEPAQAPVVNNFAQECAIIRPSKKDTDGTLQQIAKSNARCRGAREQKK